MKSSKTAPTGQWVPLLAALLLANRVSGAPALTFISQTPEASRSANGSSHAPVFSGDGRFFAFTSDAPNLTEAFPGERFLRIYLQNRSTGERSLISRTLAGTAGADEHTIDPSLSADGGQILFASRSSNLVSNELHQAVNIFRRDVAAGVTELISIGRSGEAASGPNAGWSNPLSSAARISGDGGTVVFESAATNLTADAPDSLRHIYVRNLFAHQTQRISAGARQIGPIEAVITAFADPTISSNGSRVAFASTATRVVGDITNRAGEVYIFDMPSAHTILASAHIPTPWRDSSNGFFCVQPELSANGDSVVFALVTLSSAPSPVLLCHFSSSSGSLTVLSTNSSAATRASISADGRRVAGIHADQIYVWDLPAASATVVSVDATGVNLGDAASLSATMTPTGDFVAFTSLASNLVESGVAPSVDRPQLYLRDLRQGVTRLVTVRADGGTARNDLSLRPTLSPEGRYVGFASPEDGLADGDDNGRPDVFVRDVQQATTEWVSVASPSLTRQNTSSSSWVGPNAVSVDGRYVAFASKGTPLAPAPPSEFPRIYLRDLWAGKIEALPLEAQQWQDAGTATEFALAAGGISPQLSADGNAVTCLRYLDERMNAGPGRKSIATPAAVTWINRETGQNVVIGFTTAAFDTLPWGPYPRFPISADGRRLVAPVSASPYSSVFVRDLSLAGPLGETTTGTNFIGHETLLLPVDAVLNSAVLGLVLSPDSRHLVRLGDAASARFYELAAGNELRATTNTIAARDTPVFSLDSKTLAYPADGGIALFDIASASTVLVPPTGTRLSVNGNATRLAYEVWGPDGNARQILVRDTVAGLSNIISVSASGELANGDSRSPSMTPDGRYVVFQSLASNLVADDTNGTWDIFVRDLTLGTTTLLSANPRTGRPGAGSSLRPYLGADGRTVVFTSFAGDLADSNRTGNSEVFAVRLPADDSDGDGLEDDWEYVHFGTLARDGSGDFDGDGLSDQAEFAAGTDPTQPASALRVLTLVSLGTGEATVLWPAVPGKAYRVQAREALGSAAWRNLSPPLTATNVAGLYRDMTAPGQPRRFYRVEVLSP